MAPRWIDRLFPRVQDTRGVKLSMYGSPSSAPTSPLTQPISVLSGLDFLRKSYVDRETLMRVPAFARAVRLVTGVVGSLPFHAYNAAGERIEHKLLGDPEGPINGNTKTVTFTNIALDLYLDGACLLVVKDRDKTTKFPIAVERCDFNSWSVDSNTGDVMANGVKLDPADAIVFPAPFPGLLSIAGPTVHLYQRFAALSARYADSPQPREILRGVEGLNITKEQIEELLTEWQELADQGVTRYLHSDYSLEKVDQITPEQMTLNGAHQWIVEQAARVANIDGFWLGAGQSSGMTYSNRIDLREDLKTFVLHPMLVAPIEERLSKNDITPLTQYVRGSWDSYLRLNTADRYAAHKTGLEAGFLTMDEVRAMENRPPLTEEPNDETQ